MILIFNKIREILHRNPKVSAVCILWTTLHLGLWIFANARVNPADGQHLLMRGYMFWPFFENGSEYLVMYDFSEFFVYCIVPAILFGAYKLLKLK